MTAAIHPATHFIAPDAAGDLNLWRGTREDPAPVAVLRECDTDPAVWAMVVAAVSTPNRLTDDDGALAELLAQHRVELHGMSHRTPDRCTCGATTMPLAGDDDIAERRARAFALHQAEEVRDALAARLAAQPPACFGKVWDVDCGEMTARVERVRRFVDHPGNWSAGEARRRVILDLLDGKDVPGLAADGLVQP